MSKTKKPQLKYKTIIEMSEPNKKKMTKMKATFISPYNIVELKGNMKVVSETHTKEFANCKIKIEK